MAIQITSNEVSEKEISTFLESKGMVVDAPEATPDVAEPAGDKPTSEQTDKPGESPAAKTASEPVPATEAGKPATQESQTQAARPPREKTFKSKFEKAQDEVTRLSSDLDRERGDKTRLSEELAAAKAKLADLQPVTVEADAKPAAEAEPVRPKRPKREDVGYDEDLYEAAMEKYDTELDTYHVQVAKRTVEKEREAEVKARQDKDAREAQEKQDQEFREKVLSGSEQYDDWNELTEAMPAEPLKVPPAVEATIEASDNPADLIRHFMLDHLDNGGKELQRFQAMTPVRQVMEATKLANKLAAERSGTTSAPSKPAQTATAPPAKSEAPAPTRTTAPRRRAPDTDDPLEPVGSRGGGAVQTLQASSALEYARKRGQGITAGFRPAVVALNECSPCEGLARRSKLAQTYLTIQDITYEMLLVLHNNLIAGKKVTRTWEKKFAQKGAKIGATIDIRKPPRYTVTDGTAFVAQDYTEEFVPLTVDKFKQVGCEWANTDLTLSMDDFSGRFLRPALVPLANSVDIEILNNLMNQAWNATGTPTGNSTGAVTDTPFLDAKAILFNQAALITDDMPMLLTGKCSARLSSGLAQRFNPQQKASDMYLKGAMAGMMRGSIGHGLGWDFFEDQNMPTHTTGAFAGVPVVNGAGQTGSAIVTSGWTGVGAVKKNDVIQFTGVYGVNPVTFLNTGELQNFRVTADTVNAAGAMTVPIEPAIVLAGKNQTVVDAPADLAPLVIWGTTTVANVASKVSAQNIGWQIDAVTLACVDLYVPEEGMGVKATRVSDDDLGLSFLFMSGFDMKTYSKLSRIDMLFGTTATRPEQVIRVAN